jgi:DNA-binding MarR family transcriptional regulator
VRVSRLDDPAPGSAAHALHELAVAGARVDLAVRARLGLDATEYLALRHLVTRSEPIGPVGLGKLLGISSGSATGLVDRLERDGHVERRPDAADRRRRTLAVTEATSRRIAAELQPLADAITSLEKSFPARDRDVIHRFLTGAVEIHRSVSG